MKHIFFGFILIFLFNSVFSDELNVHESSKNTDDIVKFTLHIFPYKSSDTSEEKNEDVKVDIEVKEKDDSGSEEDHHSSHCHKCVSMVRLYEKILDRKKSAKDVQRVFLGTCDVLKQQLREKCIKFYKGKGLKMIKDMLKGVDAKKICRDLHVCGEMFEESEFGETLEAIHSVLTDTTGKSHRCKNCLEVTSHLEKVLNSLKSLNFVLGKMSAMCSVYRDLYRIGCYGYFKNSIVIQYFKSVLAHENVHKICERAGRCHKRGDEEQTEEEEAGSGNSRTPDFDVDHSRKCKVCIKTVKIYEHIIDRTKTPKKVQKTFLGTCDILKPKLRYKCTNFFKGIGFQVIKDILKGVKPEKICKYLDLCRKRLENPGSEDISKDVNEKGALTENIAPCKLCGEVAYIYERLMSNERSAVSIKSNPDMVCHLLPTQYQRQCVNFLTKYHTDLTDKLLNGVKGVHLCSQLKICNVHESDSKGESTVCKIVTSVVYELVGDTKTEMNIKTVLDNVCDKVPDFLRKDCTGLLATRSGDINKHIQGGISRSVICYKLSIPDNLLKTPETLPRYDLRCELCKKIMDKLRGLINSKSTKEEIERALNKVCDKIKWFNKKLCKNLMRTFAKNIVKYLISGVPLKKICGMIGVCPLQEIKPEDSLYFLPKTNYL